MSVGIQAHCSILVHRKGIFAAISMIVFWYRNNNPRMNKTHQAQVAVLGVLVVLLGFTVVRQVGSVMAVNVPAAHLTAAAIESQPRPAPKPAVPDQNVSTQISVLNSALSAAVSNGHTAKISTADANLLVAESLQRKSLIRSLMLNSPGLLGVVAIADAVRAGLPLVIQGNIEQKLTLTGTTRVIHGDDFVHPENEFVHYYLVTPNQTYEMHLGSEIAMKSGDTVQVTGYVLDDQIATDPRSIVNISPLNKPLTGGDAIGNQNILVIPLKASDSDQEPYTTSQINGLVFNGGMPKLMSEQSYGLVSFSGDTTAWGVFPGETTFCSWPDETWLGNFVTAQGIDLSKYGRVVFLSKDTSGGCSQVGKSIYTINGKTYNISKSIVGMYNGMNQQGFPFSWTYFDFVLSHELGHALGTMHANGWDCDTQIVSGTCNHVEYGNYFDTMGVGFFSLDYNAFYKELLGWLTPARVLAIHSSGSYTIGNLESNSGVVAAKIYTGNGSQAMYYLERRVATGFDSNLNSTVWSQYPLAVNTQGLLVNKINYDYPTSPFPRLLDMHPTTLSWGDDIAEQAALTASTMPNVFTDLRSGITIGPVTHVDASSITFNVAVTAVPCVPAGPSVSGSFWATTAANGSGNAHVTITDLDPISCPGATFHTDLIVPAGWATPFQPADVKLAPDQSSTEYFSYNPINATPGVYQVGVVVTNTAAGMKTTFNDAVTVSPALSITAVNPAFGPVDSQVTITGTGFDTVDGNNTVGIYNPGGYSFSNNLPATADGNSIRYTIPDTLLFCNVQPCTTIPTPAGDYTLAVTANGAQATIPFTVGGSAHVNPTASVVGTSTLEMTYNGANKESALIGTFNVAVTAGSSDLVVNKQYAFNSFVTAPGISNMSGTMHYNQPAGTTDNGNGSYVIPAGQTALFTVTTVFNPAIMFAGAYHGVIDQVFSGTAYSAVLKIATPNTTNTILVIGEQSPYVNQISPNPALPGQKISLTGVRFADQGNIVTAMSQNGGNRSTQNLGSTQKGTLIQFTAPIMPGEYVVFVKHPTTGASNNVYLMVQGVVSASPQPTVLPDSLRSAPGITPTVLPTATAVPTNSASPSVTPTHTPTPTVFYGGGSGGGGGVTPPAPPAPASTPPPDPSSAPSSTGSPSTSYLRGSDQSAAIINGIGQFMDGLFRW